MSKIHLALMKAERNGKANLTEASNGRDNLLEEMTEVLAPRFSESSRIEREAPAGPRRMWLPNPNDSFGRAGYPG